MGGMNVQKGWHTLTDAVPCLGDLQIFDFKCAQYTEHLSTKYVWNPNQILQHQITYTTMARLRWHQSLHHNQHLNAMVLKVKLFHQTQTELCRNLFVGR